MTKPFVAPRWLLLLITPTGLALIAGLALWFYETPSRDLGFQLEAILLAALSAFVGFAFGRAIYSHAADSAKSAARLEVQEEIEQLEAEVERLRGILARQRTDRGHLSE